MTYRAVLGFAVLAWLLAGCAASAPNVAAPAPPASAAASAGTANADLEALYWQRQRAARAEVSPADADFMTGMIGHHAQALVMSRLAPTHGASPAVQRLAARIINAQNDEIESMQRWLRSRGLPVPVPQVDGLTLTVTMESPPGADQPGTDRGGMDHDGMDHAGMDHSTMDPGDSAGDEAEAGRMDHAAMNHGAMNHGAMNHGAMDHSSMPGMLSQAQLVELDAARGRDFDRLFLRYMIQHHGGAIAMADVLFGTDGGALDDEAFKLASDINVDQETEIARMELMLQEIAD